MNCPTCEKELQSKVVGEVQIDECSGCKGIWFDKDELRQVKDQGQPDLNWMDFELWKHEDLFGVSAKPLKCPVCNLYMIAINYDKTKVEIDHCIKCGGTWLDVGELEKIIAVLEDELNSNSVSGYVKAVLGEAKELLTGPEGFISEWKDLATVLRMLQLRVFVENPTLTQTLTDMQKYSPFT